MYEFDTHADFIAGDEHYLMHSYARLPVKFVRGSGAVLTDSEGRDYLDFLGGIGVVCLGHCHPRLVDALKGQETTFTSRTAASLRLRSRACSARPPTRRVT